MGWFDGVMSDSSSHNRRSKSSSGRSHSHSGHSSSHHKEKDPRDSTLLNYIAGTEPRSHSHHKESSARSIFGSGDHRHNSSRSIFGGGDHRHNSSRSSFFNFGSSHRSPFSAYRRSPRSNFLNKSFSKLRRLLRDLMYYMKRNPIKVFMLVIMPLLTSGALVTLLAKFGIRLPGGLEKLVGGEKARGGAGLGYNRRGEMQFERTRVESHGEGMMGGLGKAVGGIGGAVSLAKMFM